MIRFSLVALVAVLLSGGPAAAQFTTHQTSAAFLTAANTVGVGGTPSTVNFDGTPTGAFANGTTIGGVDFASLAATGLSVNADFATTSPMRYLGSADTGNFGLIAAGDGIRFTPSTGVQAFGLFLLSADTVQTSDFRLDAYQGGTLVNTATSTAVAETTLGGTSVYFLGFTDAGQGYTSVELTFAPGAAGAFFYSVDDVRFTPVPEPAGLLALAVVGLVARRRFR